MNYKIIINYFGQLRFYSFLDLFIFATALTSSASSIIGICLLWLSFLLYLESVHKDKLRLAVNVYAWVLPFILALMFLSLYICISFAIFSYFYAKKKGRKFWGITAPFWRALQNCCLALAFRSEIALLVFILIFIRNLIADFRDAGDDRARNIKTIPVVLGILTNMSWAFYTHLLMVIFTTVVWINFTYLNIYFLIPIVFLQIISYSLTPRLSNPKYPNMYRNKSNI